MLLYDSHGPPGGIEVGNISSFLNLLSRFIGIVIHQRNMYITPDYIAEGWPLLFCLQRLLGVRELENLHFVFLAQVHHVIDCILKR